MKRGVSYTKARAAACIATFVAAAFMVRFREEIDSRAAGQRRLASVIESSLLGQISERSGCEGDRLEAQREQVARIRIQMGGEDTWLRLMKLFGDGWTSEPVSTENKNGCTYRACIMRLRSPSLADWPAIVDAVKSSEELSGVGIAEIDMRTSGTRDRRTLDSVRILVVAKLRRAESDLAEIR